MAKCWRRPMRRALSVARSRPAQVRTRDWWPSAPMRKRVSSGPRVVCRVDGGSLLDCLDVRFASGERRRVRWRGRAGAGAAGGGDAAAGARGKDGLGVVVAVGVGIQEANAVEGMAGGVVELDAEVSQGVKRVGHQALAAGLVDGRLQASMTWTRRPRREAAMAQARPAGPPPTMQTSDVPIAAADGGARTRRLRCPRWRATPGCEPRVDSAMHTYHHCSSTSSRQKPGPMAARML